MEQRSDPDRLLFRLVSIFLALAFGIGLTGYLFFSQQKQRITGKAENVLSAVADLKVKQVVSLRRELVDDGDLLNGSIPISSITALRQDNHPLLQNVRAWLHTVRTSQHHLAILLMTPAGKVVLSEPEDQGAVGPDGVRLAREAAASGRIILSDLYQSRIAPVTRFSLLVPVFKRPRLKEDRPLGVLLVRIDPADILYPLISTWPGTSTSAETFAIRREQAEAVLLNDTRSRSNVAHTLRIPLEKTPPLAQLLDSGEKGVIRMNDQHDVPVIAAVQPVPGTSWYLVAKMDQEEVLSSVRREAFLLIVIVLLLIGGAGLGIYLLWRRQIAEQQRQHAASEQALKSVSTRYDYLSKYANDIILITDYSGKIIEANDRAAAVYGYRRDELLQLTFCDL
ncbi:MAG TPA: PAS domain S-box protein, partial [Nitrospirota bacterium]|nr:PAS domain S-box protein [Nitrospirota bacterium]